MWVLAKLHGFRTQITPSISCVQNIYISALSFHQLWFYYPVYIFFSKLLVLNMIAEGTAPRARMLLPFPLQPEQVSCYPVNIVCICLRSCQKKRWLFLKELEQHLKKENETFIIPGLSLARSQYSPWSLLISNSSMTCLPDAYKSIWPSNSKTYSDSALQ